MTESHPHLSVWEGLPTETLESERDRIVEQVTDLNSRVETLSTLLAERAIVLTEATKGSKSV